MRVVLAQPPLSAEAQEKVAEDRGVDADEEPAHVPEDDGQVDVGEELVRTELVGDPEGERHEEAEQIRYGDPLVTAADAEHFLGNGPCDGKRIELLYVLSGPDVRSLDGLQDGCLCLDDGQHHNVVEESSDDAAENLNGVGASGRQMYILC